MPGEQCDVAVFMVECTKECRQKYASISSSQSKLRKDIVAALAGRIALFWEGTLDADERWFQEGHLTLKTPVLNTQGKGRIIQGFVKQAMSHELYNAKGSGVSSGYQLAVGIAVSRQAGPSVKRAAVSQGGPKSKKQRRQVNTAWAESTCRLFAVHHMFNYFVVARRRFKCI